MALNEKERLIVVEIQWTKHTKERNKKKTLITL